jgi:hypothetical protein
VSLIIKLLSPILAQIVIEIFTKLREDAEFQQAIDVALRGHKEATNAEQRRNARRAIQRIIAAGR